MQQLTMALRKDRPELLSLLMDKVLPMLVVARQPLSPEVIAWAVLMNEVSNSSNEPNSLSGPPLRGRADFQLVLESVKELLDIGLANLFPCRPAGATGMD